MADVGTRMVVAKAPRDRRIPVLARPRRFLEARLRDPHRLRNGFVWLASASLVYSLCLLLLAVGGSRPNPEPWLRIASSGYFWWEAVFIAPVIVAGAILAAGCLHLMARTVDGDGDFDDTMALVATAAGLSTLITGVPDLVVGVLLSTGLVSPDTWWQAITQPTPALAGVWFYMLVYAASFVLLFTLTASTVHHLSRRSATVTGATAFVIYQGFVFVFVR